MSDKVQLVNFRKFKPDELKTMFNASKKDIKINMFFVSCDGRIFINKKDPTSKALKTAFDLIVNQPRENLEELEKIYSAKYPQIRTVLDIAKLKENTERFEALIMFLIPTEYKRRGLERAYYKE